MKARAALLGLAALAASGCLGWQESYNDLARRECRKEIDSGDRRACLERVEEIARNKRDEARDH